MNPIQLTNPIPSIRNLIVRRPLFAARSFVCRSRGSVSRWPQALRFRHRRERAVTWDATSRSTCSWAITRLVKTRQALITRPSVDNALAANTTGQLGVAVGAFALQSNTTGDHNTALGAFSLNLNTTGSNNTATGIAALMKNTTGSTNTATGISALNMNTTGHDNTADGAQALRATPPASLTRPAVLMRS